MSEPFVAEIKLFAGNFPPKGYAFCDGQLLPISQNTALFSLLGTTYGGNGKSNFALPDLQGRAPMHPGQGPGLSLHDLGETGGLRYLSMEFVKGLTLKQLVEAGDILPTPVGLRIAKQICAGLAAAHEVGVIHRDIKPQNIIIEATGGLKIMDFGIARLKEERGMTAEGTVVGTPDYMSPEQARGQQLDFRSDIYSTGVVLYEVFTGTIPFEGETPLAVVLKHIQETPPSPQTRNPRIDPRISQIILKCMQKDAKDRYQTINDLYEALTRVTAQAA